MSQLCPRCWTRLAATIDARKGGDPATSYTAKLLNDRALAAKKLGEEAVETVIAAVARATGRAWPPKAPTCSTTGWCCWRRPGVSTDAVADKLAAREGRSGLAEKASRGPNSALPAGTGWASALMGRRG